jgi:Fe-S-cluster containining protein
VITDPKEVARLGAEKAEENLAFRRWRTAQRIPDREFQVIASAIAPRIDCRTCGNCCRNSVVPVNDSEIEAIASYAGASVEQAMQRYTEPDPEDSSQRVLRGTASGCVFLEGNDCLIYEARPQTCRDFPHITPGAHSLGARQESHARWAALCPIIYNALEEEKRLRGYPPASAGQGL